MTDTCTFTLESRTSKSAAFRSALDVIAAVEPRSAEPMAAELADQRSSLKLIASENYASPAVLLAMGSWLSDKDAEGTIDRGSTPLARTSNRRSTGDGVRPGPVRRPARLRAAALRHRREPGGGGRTACSPSWCSSVSCRSCSPTC